MELRPVRQASFMFVLLIVSITSQDVVYEPKYSLHVMETASADLHDVTLLGSITTQYDAQAGAVTAVSSAR